MLKKNTSGKTKKRSKGKSRPRYFSHPAFIALVIVNIVAAGYGAFLWFNQNKSSLVDTTLASAGVVKKSSSSVQAEKAKKRYSPFGNINSSDSVETPIRPSVVAAVGGLLQSSTSQKPLTIPEHNTKNDTLKIESAAPTQSVASAIVARKEPIEMVQAPVTSNAISFPPVLEVSAELISHNAAPGKAKAFIQPEKLSGPTEKDYYTVAKGVAHFHNQPDPGTPREAFINHWNKAILKPIKDQNGFIYVVYTNHWGQTSRGWLAKKDLQPLK